jgi:hypothetical protein
MGEKSILITPGICYKINQFIKNGSLCKSMYLIYLCCCQWHLPFIHSKIQENCYTYYLSLVYTTDLISVLYPGVPPGLYWWIEDCYTYYLLLVYTTDLICYLNSWSSIDELKIRSLNIKLGQLCKQVKDNMLFSYKGQSTIKCFSSSISPLEQFVHFLSDLISTSFNI